MQNMQNTLNIPEYFICPICATAITPNKKNWVCQNNHSFDVAKQGYVNLLPVQHKKSKQPGDDANMVLARNVFLNAGFYAPLKTAILEALSTCVGDVKKPDMLDVGCGEGYYTLDMAGLARHLTAIDISKSAVLQCAKKAKQTQQRNISTIVASASALPLQNDSVDILTSIFSPILPDAFYRVLKKQPSSKLCVVKPAQKHLFAIRDQLFDVVNLHDSDKFIHTLAPFFSLGEKKRVTFSMQLDNTALIHLLAMTPYAYKAKPEKRATLESLPSLTVTADFYIYLFDLVEAVTG